MLRYIRTSGEWLHGDGSPVLDANKIAVIGWSGNDSNPDVNPLGIKGKNNPAQDWVHSIGPLPAGLYDIHWLTDEEAKAHAHLGPMIAQLTPHPENVMKGRSGFFIHGAARDSKLHGQESKGCTVLEHVPRCAVRMTGETLLEVV